MPHACHLCKYRTGYPNLHNKAEPSLIRTEADELTYALHIMVRYEIEKKLISADKNEAVVTLNYCALLKAWQAMGMSDEEMVRFASACSAIAISRFPLPLYPPTMEEVAALMQ